MLYCDLLNYLDALNFELSEPYLLGDFNCNITSIQGKEFVKTMKDIGLKQLIKETTRVRAHSSTTIDLILTNESHRVTSSGVLEFSLRDHYFIYCNRTDKVPRPRPKVTNVSSYKDFDPIAYTTNLDNIPWDIIALFDNPENARFCMEAFLEDLCNNHALLRTLRVRGTQPPWMSEEIATAVKSLDAIKRKAVRSKT